VVQSFKERKGTKGVIRIRKSTRKTDKTMAKRQKDKRNYLQNTAYKTNDRATRTPLKTGDELMCSGRVSSSCSTSGTGRVTLATNPVISSE